MAQAAPVISPAWTLASISRAGRSAGLPPALMVSAQMVRPSGLLPMPSRLHRSG